MNYESKSFQKLLEECGGEKSIILGNGFGLSFDAAMGGNYFNWNSLLSLCDIEVGSELYRLLSENRFDFELVHQKLNNAIDVLKLYEPLPLITLKLEQEILHLREQLIVAVGSSHPPSFSSNANSENQQKELDAKVENCRKFLREFSKIFTLNYDLLLYWVRCYKNKHLGQDSFSKDENHGLVFIRNDEADYLFPHGSLFIYRDGRSETKSGSSKDKPILARLKSNIEKGKFPMCISEGTGEQKLKEIEKNHYLLFAYNMIKKSKGTIFTFGCSFLDGKDSHIIEAICNSSATRVVIGEYKPNKVSEARLVLEFERAKEKLGSNIEVVIANSADTQIW